MQTYIWVLKDGAGAQSPAFVEHRAVANSKHPATNLSLILDQFSHMSDIFQIFQIFVAYVDVLDMHCTPTCYIIMRCAWLTACH